MNVYQIPIDREQLAAIPREERTLLLVLGHALNEVVILSKLLHFAANANGPNEAYQDAEVGQVLLLLRLAVGKLNETWNLLSTGYFSKKEISLKYYPRLSEEARACLKDLEKAFAKGSPITSIRTEFSFHAPQDETMEAAFNDLSKNEREVYYLSTSRKNTFYQISELIITHAMLRTVSSGDREIALKILLDTVNSVTNKLVVAVNEIIKCIIQNYKIGNIVKTKLFKILDAPRISEFSIPFFTEEKDGY
jgi:hypothetical protein